MSTILRPMLDPAFLRGLDAVSAPLYLHAGGPMLYANAAMQRLLGFSLEELLAGPHEFWASKPCQVALRAYGHRCLQESGPLPAHEVDAITVYGSVRHLEITACQVQAGGQALALTTCQDLSDIRHVQNSLLEVGRVMHQILENDPVPSFVIDAEHRVTHWNAACAQLTGLPAHQMLGRVDAWRAFYPEPRHLLVDLIVDAQADHAPVELNGSAVRRSTTITKAYETEDFFPVLGGSPRWLFSTAAPLLDIEGKIVGAISTMLDITQRRQAEDELKRHKQELEEMVAKRTAELLVTHDQLESFLENASVGILCTEGRRITRSNRKLAEIFELENGAVGLPTRQFFPSPHAYAELVRAATPVLGAGESLTHETQMRTATGRLIWVQLIAYASSPSSPKAGVWWLLQDRSEVTRAQEELVLNYLDIKKTNARLAEAQGQLLQSEKLASIGQLAAGVAHEINNPVGFVSANLSSLRRYVEPLLHLISLYGQVDLHAQSEDLQAEIAALRRSADIDFVAEDLPQLLNESDDGLNRVKRIVQDLKDFSRVDHADWQEADIHHGLDSTLNVARHEIKYKADIVKDYGDLPPVRCLAAQLNQVFMNIIVNAAHAIEGHGEIRLRTFQQDEQVCIEISDSGKGMSDEVKRRIFDPFYTTKPVGQGTGLGLSLSFSIIKKHGGRIEVDSMPGRGSAFRVWIPVDGPGTGKE